MSQPPGPARIPIAQFLEQIRGQLLPLGSRVSYFPASQPFTEEDLRDYLEDPLAALPPAAREMLPELTILLVPFLEKANGREKTNGAVKEKPKDQRASKSKRPRETEISVETASLPPDGMVCFEKPPEGKWWRGVHWLAADRSQAVVALSTAQIEVADYHYDLYRHIALLMAELSAPQTLADYLGIIREELNSGMHGEVDEQSWQMKQAFLRRRSNARRDSKEFRDYARQSYVDTLTLYLHGICCDIDVETGPRQLPSRYLRRRLKLLQGMYPPPDGYAVFPEELDRLPANSSSSSSPAQ